MTGRDAERRDPVEVGTLALQRVLALEGRNALARVELAASELVQLEASPAARDRLAVIRSAVDELDDVLDKIERLSDPRRDPAAGACTPLARVWNPLVERIAPALLARGVVLEPTGEWPALRLAMPAAVLERLLLAFLRVAISAQDGGGPVGEEGPIVLSIACRDAGDSAELFVVATGAQGDRRLELERAGRVELEVALAEWRGELVDETVGAPGRLGLRLRKAHSDD